MKRQTPRNAAIKALVSCGAITTVGQIFDHIPKSAVAPHLRTNYNRLTRLINSPDEFKLKELISIGEMFEIDAETMCRLMLNQYFEDKKQKAINP